MNELTRVPFNNASVYEADVDLNALSEFVNQSGAPAMPGERVRFRKGEYLFGQDQRKVSVTEPFIMNTGEILFGLIKLEDGEVTKRMVGRVADRFKEPDRRSLGDEELIGTSDDPWKPFTAIVMRNTNFDIFCFTSITISGRHAVMDLLRRYLQRCRQQPGKLPAVLLGVGTVRNRKHNTTYLVPKLTIVGFEPWEPEATAPACNPASTDAKSDVNEDDVPWDDGAPPAEPEDFGR